MPVLFVARSAKLARWASDVGFGKHVYKIGICEQDPKELASGGWAGETDWKIVRHDEVEGLSEDEAIERLDADGDLTEHHAQQGAYHGCRS